MSASRPGRCLGEKLADLADGRLDPAARDRAYAHLAGCPACRASLESQRDIRSRLAQSVSAPVDPSDDLMARLRGLAAAPPPSIPAPAAGVGRAVGVGRAPAGAAGVRPPSTVTSTRPSGASRRHRRRVALVSAAGAAAFAVVAVVGGASSVVSGPARPSQSIAPLVDRLADAHMSTADQMPFSGPRIVTVAVAAPSGSTAPAP